MPDATFLSSENLIRLARKMDPEVADDIRYPKDALEVFWGNGVSDQQEGSVSEYPFMHVFRVANWLLWTDDHGFKQQEVYNDSDGAQHAIAEWSKSLEQRESEAS